MSSRGMYVVLVCQFDLRDGNFCHDDLVLLHVVALEHVGLVNLGDELAWTGERKDMKWHSI